jgi:hypothetical protein
MMSRSESAKLNGRRRTTSTIENSAVVPPIPSAMVATAAAVNPGVLVNVRKA